MGFFRKLFGGGDEAPAPEPETAPAPAPPVKEPELEIPAPLDDPYRGPAYVEADAADEMVEVGPAAPIFHYRGRVLALEPNRRGPLPLRSMVYTGLAHDMLVLRKLTFGNSGYRVDWEHITEFPEAYDRYVTRIGDRIVMPRKTGVVAIHLATGRPCWELPHPAALQQQPRLDKAGNLVLVFTDQSWMVVALRDGATVSEGVARNDRDVENLLKGTHELGWSLGREARYAGASVYLDASMLRVTGGRSTAGDGPAAPTKGEYPFDGQWQGGRWLTLAGGKLVVQMERGFGDKRWGAIGLLDPTSLEPLQLLELGQVTASLTGWTVDELIVVDTDLPDTPDDVMFIIDPESERVVALLREGKADAFLFDRDGNRIWAAPV